MRYKKAWIESMPFFLKPEFDHTLKSSNCVVPCSDTASPDLENDGDFPSAIGYQKRAAAAVRSAVIPAQRYLLRQVKLHCHLFTIKLMTHPLFYRSLFSSYLYILTIILILINYPIENLSIITLFNRILQRLLLI